MATPREGCATEEPYTSPLRWAENRLLLEKGASIGALVVVRLLLEKGASVDVLDHSILHCTVQHLEVTLMSELLLNY